LRFDLCYDSVQTDKQIKESPDVPDGFFIIWPPRVCRHSFRLRGLRTAAIQCFRCRLLPCTKTLRC